MAVPGDAENFFSDDDLDDLPLDTFAELEKNAIQFTQAQQPNRFKPPPSSDYGDDFEDEDLDDAVIIDESKNTPELNPAHIRRNSTQPAQREPFRNQQGTISNQSPNIPNRQRPNIPAPPKFNQQIREPPRIPIPQHESLLAQQGSLPYQDEHVDDLQKQIEDLIRERHVLQEDLKVKAGEIAIVRSKQEKTVKEYEREMIAIRKTNDDRLAKQQKQLEAAQIKAKNAATERDFIAQDLAEESGRNRRLNRAKEPEKNGSSTATPKKRKALPHRDGFDDDEIEFLSPSKISPSKNRRTTNSPAKPGKRKRKAIESPAGALQVINDEPLVEEPQKMVLDESILKRLAIQDDRFDFLGTILDHRKDSKHLRTIEEFGKYKLPSNPDESLQSAILGKIPSLGYKKPTTDLPIEFCEMLISMWSACFAEKFYTPIYLFVDMLTLAVELKTTAIAPHIIDFLVPLLQATVDVLVIPRFQSLPITKEMEEIHTTSCLSLLHITALGCMGEHQHIVRFWKLMRYDIIVMLMSPLQLVSDNEILLRLLSTSIFRDSFGAPCENQETTDAVTTDMIDRFTSVLVKAPFKPRSMERLERTVVSRFRVQILQLMIGMTRAPFASQLIIKHQLAIGRLVCLISDELDVLYDYKPGREESARIITLATRLLYHLIMRHDIDMQKKLSAIHGGQQKYLLCLARLNYSEDDLVLESGIPPDVAACANEMLSTGVTMEEGDAIHAAFGQ